MKNLAGKVMCQRLDRSPRRSGGAGCSEGNRRVDAGDSLTPAKLDGAPTAYLSFVSGHPAINGGDNVMVRQPVMTSDISDWHYETLNSTTLAEQPDSNIRLFGCPRDIEFCSCIASPEQPLFCRNSDVREDSGTKYVLFRCPM